MISMAILDRIEPQLTGACAKTTVRVQKPQYCRYMCNITQYKEVLHPTYTAYHAVATTVKTQCKEMIHYTRYQLVS